jgi:uncharacterized protein YhfF
MGVAMPPKTENTDAFWRAFAESRGNAEGDHVVVAFGDSPAMATELSALVVKGRKRATCSLAQDYSNAPETLPKVGDLVVVVDGTGTPQCIWRTTDIEIKPLIAVDDQFAWDEGEGDRSRDWWLNAHRIYFRRQAVRCGFAFDDNIAAVFERFEIVWPLALVDQNRAGGR